MIRQVFIGLFFLLPLWLNATHNRAGEITYKHIQGCTYEITIVTYTYTLSLADRNQLEVHWGDDTKSLVDRVQKYTIPGELYFRNTYVGTHTFPGQGVYRITMLDENRNYGVINIPNSVMEPFTLETIIKITCDNSFSNQSPVLLYPPIDKAKLGEVFIHNPSAYDPDGDSLSYRLTVCLGANGLPITGYSLPYASNSISVNAITGDLIWDFPAQTGIVNVAMMIEEWRNGFKIGQILRDIQIEVFESDNRPPQFSPLQDLCVTAGDLVQFTVSATDPDNNSITLSATGGPFQASQSPAIFDTVTGPGSVAGTFTWQTECSHVRQQKYHILFRARDYNSQLSLVKLQNMYITVVAPSPENVVLTPTSNSVTVAWDPSVCTNAIGYDIYRRNSPSGWMPGPCETGVPAYTGYVKVGRVNGHTSSLYLDNNSGQGLPVGYEYCYRVVAFFADSAESYASTEVCTELVRGIPTITHVSIEKTDVPAGKILVVWSKPTEFDSVAAAGPYKYLIYRSYDFWGQNLQLADSLSDINDTTYVDSLKNTLATPSSYRIDFYNDSTGKRFLIGQPHVASSVFITAVPDDEKLILNIAHGVPWINYRYDIFRQNPVTLSFDSIGSATSMVYVDTGLVNGNTYCYKIRSAGHYLSGPFVSPLLNWSQELCAVPADTTAPCQPPLSVTSNCEAFINTLRWTNPNHLCADDVIGYHIYFTPTYEGEFQLIATILNPEDTMYEHINGNGLAGCYYVAAFDSFYNERPVMTRYCVDDCQYYELPNIFSPDGEGTNDYYRPGPYYNVERVNMQIFNRWGKLVYVTDDPDIMWDGKDMDSQKPCTEGVYYYICDVYEKRLTGIEVRTLTGFIELVRIIKKISQ
jgi:gliding motility-associated-like protein